MTLTINSKTIGGAVASGVVGWLIRHLLDYFSLFEKLTAAAQSPETGKWFKTFFLPQYSLLDIFIILLLALGVYHLGAWLMRTFFGSAERLAKAKQELARFNNMPLGNQNLLCKWRVEFDEWDRPQVQDLQPYCTRHGQTPIPMQYNMLGNSFNCLGCPNQVPNPQAPKSLIQGELEGRWEALRGAL